MTPTNPAPVRLIAGFVALLALVGLFTALAVGRWPDLERAPFPPFFWPLPAALVFDLVTRPLVHAGRMPELPMGARFAGVIVGAIVYQVVRLLAPAA